MPPEGAASGGLIGAAAGSALGNAKDQEEGYIPQKRYRYIPSPPIVYYDYFTYRPRPPRRYVLTEIHFILATELRILDNIWSTSIAR